MILALRGAYFRFRGEIENLHHWIVLLSVSTETETEKFCHFILSWDSRRDREAFPVIFSLIPTGFGFGCVCEKMENYDLVIWEAEMRRQVCLDCLDCADAK